MSRQGKSVDENTGGAASPRLDASRLTRGPLSWLTPNRIVKACRMILGLLLLVVVTVGPDGVSSIEMRFLLAYVVVLVAIVALPRISAVYLGLLFALLFGIRWAFALDTATAKMLATQCIAIICALAPVLARDLRGLAGLAKGHMSFTERRTLYRHGFEAGRHPKHARAAPTAHAQAAASTPIVALLDYRPEPRGEL
jgi:hypothetical protein